MKARGTRSRQAGWLAVGVLLGGCATTVPPEAGSNPADPWERMNRHVYAFNRRFDKDFGEPTARAYNRVLPKVVRDCLSNMFDNVGEVPNTVNHGLQGHVVDALRDLGRLLINSTVGAAGCFDVAKQVGIERNRQNFGVTMGKWGVGQGPYVVLPILGPSTARQAVGLVPDYFYLDPLSYLRPVKDDWYLGTLRLLGDRAEIVEAAGLVETAALDEYAFLRDGYLQRLRSRVYDGNPPPPPPEEDPDAVDPGRAPGPAPAAVQAPAPTPAPVQAPAPTPAPGPAPEAEKRGEL